MVHPVEDDADCQNAGDRKPKPAVGQHDDRNHGIARRRIIIHALSNGNERGATKFGC